MVKMKIPVIIAFLAAAAVGLWLLFSTDEKDRVRRQFDQLTEVVQKEEKEPPLTSAAKANRSKEFFTDPFTFISPAHDLQREVPLRDLPARMLALRSAYSILELDFADMEITLTSETTARVAATATLTGRIKTGDHTRDIQELNCHLEKQNDTWLFAGVEIVEVLAQ